MAHTSLDHYLKHREGCLYNYIVLWANITPSGCTCCSAGEAKSKWTLTVRISNVGTLFFMVRRFFYLQHAVNLRTMYFAYRMNLSYLMILRKNTYSYVIWRMYYYCHIYLPVLSSKRRRTAGYQSVPHVVAHPYNRFCYLILRHPVKMCSLLYMWIRMF